jgi:hypothetical protein
LVVRHIPSQLQPSLLQLQKVEERRIVFIREWLQKQVKTVVRLSVGFFQLQEVNEVVQAVNGELDLCFFVNSVRQ